MVDSHNVFISWSGERSGQAAGALRDWLPIVLQAAKPWMSSSDIEKGSRGLDEVGRALEGMSIGIICLTPENLTCPWILYEAGALSKTLDAKTRVCTYLLAGLQPQDITAPLGMFQSTKAVKEDTRKLVHTINKALEAPPVPDANLEAVFDGMWPRLEVQLNSLPEPAGTVQPSRSVPEMVGEILELSRAAANSRKAVEELGAYLPVYKQLMAKIAEQFRSAPTHAADSFKAGLEALSKPADPQKFYRAALDAIGKLPDGTRKIFFVKLQYDDEIKRIEGVAAVEDAIGRLIVLDESGKVVAKFADRVENWWTESTTSPGPNG
jgi:hypothetical protein